MAYASRTYTPSSSTTTFALTTSGGDPIGYIQESDISVKVGGVTYTNAASGVNTYQITGTSTVEQPSGGNVVLNSGTTATVVLQRETAIQSATVTYTAGSTLTASDLNNADNQIRFGLQEFSDDYAALFTGTGDLTGLGAFLGSGDTWASNNAKAATTGAIDARVDSKIDTALTSDVSGGDGVTITDNSPGAGQIRVDLDADIAALRNMQTGAAGALAALTQTELEILDGATVTTDELNKLDGVTATTAEINYVDGVTSNVQTQLDAKQPLDADLTNLAGCQIGASAALAALTSTEVGILDGATLTTTELNYVDGVTSNIQTQLGNKQPADGELDTLAGMQNGTASILAGGTALTSTLTELNQLDGITLADTASLDTTSDTKVPTSKAIATHVAGAVTAVGGFKAIAGPTNFDSTQPAQGVVVSIGDVGSGFTTSSNEITITNGAGSGNNVRITGFPAALAATTITDDTGLQVTSDKNNSTSGSPNVHRYVYHKLLAKESDVIALSDDINDFNERYRSDDTGNNPTSNNHAGDLFFNQGSNTMYVRNGANNAWAEVTSSGDFKFLFLCPKNGGSGAPTFNGSEKEFDLRETSNSGSGASVTSAAQLTISVNGVIQKPNAGTNESGLDGFVLADSNTIKFCGAPASGDEIFVIQSGSAVTLNAPAINTVSTDVLQNLAVTNGKIADDTIAEVKLDIHNAPSGTDKFLAYTSNGMEWDVPADATKMPLAGGTFTGDVVFDNATNAGNDLTWDMSDNALEFDDNVKATFGDGGDLELYHDGSNSFIKENGTGVLKISGSAGVYINKYDNTETCAAFLHDAGCELYFNNVKEFETKSGGVKLNGHSESIVTALTSAASLTIDFGLSNHFSCTMGHNITFNNPTTESIGQSGTITLTQDGTGSRTASWGNQFLWAGGTAPTLSTAANAVDRIDYVVVAAGKIHCVASLAIA